MEQLLCIHYHVIDSTEKGSISQETLSETVVYNQRDEKEETQHADGLHLRRVIFLLREYSYIC